MRGLAVTRPKPAHQAALEGNPSKRPLREALRPPPSVPRQPNWKAIFPLGLGATDESPDEADLLRREARKEWKLVVEGLDDVGVLALLDATVLRDYCVCVARIAQCERDISRNGVWVKGERGAQKNPAATTANQYRTQLRFYVAELGLSPSARSRLGPPEGADDGDDDNPFDG